MQAGTTIPQPIHIPPPAFQASTSGLRFVLLIEGTAAAASMWPDARAHCVEPLLREMDRGKLGACEFAVVVYRTRMGSCAGAQLDTSGWLSSVAEVRQVLDGLQLLGGGSHVDTCLVDALLEVMALLEQPSRLTDSAAAATGAAAHPPCQALLVCASDFSRAQVVLDYPSIPHIAPSTGRDTSAHTDQDGGNTGLMMFRHMSNGSWRHNHISLLAAMKHSHHLSLSLVTLKERNQTGMVLFVCCFLGYCAQGGLIPSMATSNKTVVQQCVVRMMKGQLVLVSPNWPAARAILSAEQQARQVKAQMSGSQGGAAGVPGEAPRVQGTPGTNMIPMPSPSAFGNMTTPPLPLPMDHFAQHAQGAAAAQPIPTGMIPTPPSSTQPGMAAAAAGTPSGWVPQPTAAPMVPTPATAAGQGLRPPMYPNTMQGGGMGMDPMALMQQQHAQQKQQAMQQQQPPQHQQQGMGMGMGMYGGTAGQPGLGHAPNMQAQAQQYGGMPGQAAYGAMQQYGVQQQYNPAQGMQSQQPQHMGGASWPGHEMQAGWPQGTMQGMTPTPQQMQPQPQMQQPGMQQQQQQQQAQAQRKSVVWRGRLGIHQNLLPTLHQATPIIVASCVAETSFNPQAFVNWPGDLVISGLTPSTELNNIMRGGGQQQAVKVTLRVTQPVSPTAELSYAYAMLVDDMSKRACLGSVPLGSTNYGREIKILVQLMKGGQLPGADATINCAYVV